MKITAWLLISGIYGSLIFLPTGTRAEEEITIRVSEDADISVERFPSPGNYLVVWLAPEYGFRPSHRTMAKNLSVHEIEVWQSNIAESLFLPQGTRSLKELDGKYVADVIEYAHKTTGKKILVAGDSYAALSALLGAHQWQQRKHTDSYLIGAILFSPYTYAYIPPLGQEPEFMPIVSATNIPIIIYQAKNSAIFGEFDSLVDRLQQHKNPVYIQYIPQVMSLFYENPPTRAMLENAKPVPAHIRNMIALLEKHEVPTHPIPLESPKKVKSGIDITLKPFTGKLKPIPIRLKDIQGNTVTRDDFTGQVTVINFWATWCPPCIQEIPLLNRLKKKMAGLPFELISINYAEEKDIIIDFMENVHVDFPVLLDHNGEFAQKWNVISYPSTFVIDTDGKIVFGVNSAIEWDDPEVVKKIKSLLQGTGI